MIPFEPDYAVHPGETLKEVLTDRNMSQKYLADACGVHESEISNIIHRRQSLSPDLCLDLGEATGISWRFWWNLECNYRMDCAKVRRRRRVRRNGPRRD